MSIYKTVVSDSDPNVEYEVTLDRFGKWHCDCMSHVMKVSRGEKDVKCKHIIDFIKELSE